MPYLPRLSDIDPCTQNNQTDIFFMTFYLKFSCWTCSVLDAMDENILWSTIYTDMCEHYTILASGNSNHSAHNVIPSTTTLLIDLPIVATESMEYLEHLRETQEPEHFDTEMSEKKLDETIQNRECERATPNTAHIYPDHEEIQHFVSFEMMDGK